MMTDAELLNNRKIARVMKSLDLSTKAVFSTTKGTIVMTLAEAREVFTVSGISPTYDDSVQRIVPRKDLQGKPRFAGFLGPMWGGDDTPLRYETQEQYDALSV